MTFMSRYMLKRSVLLVPQSSLGNRQQQHCCRHVSRHATTILSRTASYKASAGGSGEGELMRVAVIGGGVAGLSTALHLAPLVHRGLIDGPIDVYEGGTTSYPQSISHHNSKREIGVGIWSSALEGFRSSDRDSHRFTWESLTSRGNWIGKVGYRTPNGSWLVESELPVKNDENASNAVPSLLFIRQVDLLSSLRKAVEMEESLGTIKLHQGKEGSPDDSTSTFVTGVSNESENLWSAPLILGRFGKRRSDRDYHLIVGAGGMGSRLRKEYQGVLSGSYSRLTGTSVLHDNDDPNTPPSTGVAGSGSSRVYKEGAPLSEPWQQSRQEEVTHIMDRHYTVFRGNSNLRSDQVSNNEDFRSFQTWGEGKSMRFASVPLHYSTGTKGERSNNGKEEERQTWFITIDDDEITRERDPTKRKNMLLAAFADWHDPICRIVEATPADEIMMERAFAHQHAATPVLKMNEIWKQLQQGHHHGGDGGPAMVFLGDAFMTVDPILAQGFTVAMEGAECMSRTVERTCSSSSSYSSPNSNTLSFDPYVLRDEIMKHHHAQQMERILRLLRATELVQAFGQPHALLFLHQYFIRPAMRLTPNFIKQPLFDAVVKYSLGGRK